MLVREVAAMLWLFIAVLFSGAVRAHIPHACPENFADRPALKGHVEHSSIISGRFSFKKIFNAGQSLFVTRFNHCDGQGRPAATGNGNPTQRTPDQPLMIRTSGPDSTSCLGCHNQPGPGGAGDFVANVFVLAQLQDPVNSSVSSDFSNERNSLGMNGSGAVELLAREMTKALQTQAQTLSDGRHVLNAKGVQFEITKQGGEVVGSKGIDTDLIVKPFHQAGVVRSLREFTVNAFNHHHGMQAEERFDLNPATGLNPDFDQDSVPRELTIGDITATVVFQAALGHPTRRRPKTAEEAAQVARGEKLFDQVSCTSCHVPQMILDDPVFTEPGPYNPPGTFSDTAQAYSFDLTKDSQRPRLKRRRDGKAIVNAYTDLKRHNLCDDPSHPDPIRALCNESFDQGRPAQDGRPGREFFITRKLWDIGSSSPYGHRGDMNSLTEAIDAHGGEARASRDSYMALSVKDRLAIIDFLNSLVVESHVPNVGPIL